MLKQLNSNSHLPSLLLMDGGRYGTFGSVKSFSVQTKSVWCRACSIYFEIF
jgi:hypothetical protein